MIADILNSNRGKSIFTNPVPPKLTPKVQPTKKPIVKKEDTPVKKEKDQYGKAGLPNPTETYTSAPEKAPIGMNAADKIIQANDLEKLYASSLNAAKRPKRGSTKGSSRGGEGVPDWMAKSLANMDPKYLQSAQEDLAKRQAYQQQVQAAYLTGNAQNLANAGRTPYNDATLRNAALIKSMLGK
jgi:hypothetical protein